MQVSSNISAMRAAMIEFSASAHNVANSSTEGFKTIEVAKTAGKNGLEVSTYRSEHRTDITDEMLSQMRSTYDFKANAKFVKFQEEMVGTVINMMA